jgi:hypothetical protein
VVDSATARAIHDASDHLPLYADYQLPALLQVAVSLDVGTAIVGGAPWAPLAVGNPAVAPADELDYSLAAPAGFSAPAGTFQVLPGGTDLPAIGMDAGTPGFKAGTLAVTSDDPDRPAVDVALSGTVLEHAVPSADPDVLQLVASLDLGMVADPDTAEGVAAIHDLDFGPLRALLSVHAADLTGDPGFFLAGGFAPQTAGDAPAQYPLGFSAGGAALGEHSATLVFHTRDGGDLPGGLDLADVRFDLVVTVADGPVAAAEIGPGAPARTGFVGIRPNPFRSGAEIRFGLARPARTRLLVVDVAGRAVRTLVDRDMGAGEHGLAWDGRDARGCEAAPGIYFVRLAAGDVEETRKLLRLR